MKFLFLIIFRLQIALCSLLRICSAYATGSEMSSSVSLTEWFRSRVEVPDNLESLEIPSTRSQRFPSREERLQVYLSNWYLPPCESHNAGKTVYQWNYTYDFATVNIYESSDQRFPKTYKLESRIEPDKAFFVDRQTILDCQLTEGSVQYASRIFARKNMQLYCGDVTDSLLTAFDRQLNNTVHETVPVILQFGDLRHSHVFHFMNIPQIKKFRSATSPAELAKVVSTDTLACLDSRRTALSTAHSDYSQTPSVSFQPIIWKLATPRHFRLLQNVYSQDTAWSNKHPMAVFRGQLTGSLNTAYNKDLTDIENCNNMPRCRLVLNSFNSTLVHAKLTSTRNRMPSVLGRVNIMAKKTTIEKLMRFKAIIILEGNDVASGLKWALLSQSVVLMPIPKHTSWAMEELLEPWVHYVPLNEDATDVEAKMKWIVEHDEIAQRIAQRATLWMEDLVFHPDAKDDDRWIEEQILQRYAAQFARLPDIAAQ
jgi:hypothetical protein